MKKIVYGGVIFTNHLGIHGLKDFGQDGKHTKQMHPNSQAKENHAILRPLRI